MKTKTLIGLAGILAVALVLAIGAAYAGPQLWSGGKVVAQCTGTETISVDVGFENNKAGNLDPVFGDVNAVLQYHVPGEPGWTDSGIMNSATSVGPISWPNDPSQVGDTVDVVTLTLQNICTDGIPPEANAVRVEVSVDVTNAKSRGSTGTTFIGRCVSIPNPCR